MKRLIASFFGTTFLLIIVQMSIIGFTAWVGQMSFTEAMAKATIYDVHTITIGSQEQIFYIFNVKRYIDSIKNSLLVNLATFNLEMPELPKVVWTDALSVLKTIPNVLFYVINWLILITNATVLLPTKLLMTPIIFLIAIIGIDVSNINILDAFTKIYAFQIGYINYLT